MKVQKAMLSARHITTVPLLIKMETRSNRSRAAVITSQTLLKQCELVIINCLMPISAKVISQVHFAILVISLRIVVAIWTLIKPRKLWISTFLKTMCTIRSSVRWLTVKTTTLIMLSLRSHSVNFWRLFLKMSRLSETKRQVKCCRVNTVNRLKFLPQGRFN